MRTTRTLAGLALAGFVLASTAQGATAISPHHPLVGTWSIAIPGEDCTETYVVRADGTTIVTSAQEVVESEFEVTPEPVEGGFYRWSDTIVKGNGRKDCSGNVTEIGRKSTFFLRFSPRADRFVICREPNLDACFGPFVRADGMRV